MKITSTDGKVSIVIFVVSVTVVPLFILLAALTDADWMQMPAFGLLATPFVGIWFAVKGLTSDRKKLAVIGLTLNVLVILGEAAFLWHFFTVAILG